MFQQAKSNCEYYKYLNKNNDQLQSSWAIVYF